MDLRLEGIKRKIIAISEDEKQITYIYQNKNKDLTKPEEIVQLEAFLKLVIKYNYKPSRIRLYEPIKMGVETKQADMVVYNDDACLVPHILVECKKQEVSDAAFKQAVEQAYSYSYALPNDVKYIWVTSGLKDEYYSVDKSIGTRVQSSDIPQCGVKSLSAYKYVYDAENLEYAEGMQKYFDLSVIEQDKLTRCFKQAHDSLWAGGQLNPSEAFDELDKLIFCKIWDERKYRKVGEPYDFQIILISKDDIKDEDKRRVVENENLQRRITDLYEEGRRQDPEVFRDNIRLSPEKIRSVVGYLEAINLGDTDLDSKGRAFETFMGSFFRGTFGQYFTPRSIVKFTVDVLPITKDSKVLDTSCGSGGFLLYALNKVRAQATKLYPNYKTNVKQRDRWHPYWHDFASNNLYGIEISEQISRAAKMNMIIHDDGHTNVITSDGLISDVDIERITENKGFKYGTFDFIITNPPFGSSVRQTEKAYLKTFGLGKKEEDWLAVAAKPAVTRENQSTEVLFIEQAYRFLTEGGYLAIVIPDGILTNSSLQYVRDSVENWFRIIAVISMPQTAFAANGAGVKSSVLFLKKWSKKDRDAILNKKEDIIKELLLERDYINTLATWNEEKKTTLKKLEGFSNTTGLGKLPEIKKTTEYKSWSSELSGHYTAKVNALKDDLTESYISDRKKKLADYPIFMAIAEDIGFDSTGKSTGKNELDFIGEELTKFIIKVK